MHGVQRLWDPYSFLFLKSYSFKKLLPINSDYIDIQECLKRAYFGNIVTGCESERRIGRVSEAKRLGRKSLTRESKSKTKGKEIEPINFCFCAYKN